MLLLVALSPGRAGDPTGVTAPRRLAYYIAFFTFALFAFFLTTRTAKDRGSDAERPLPPVRGNPERPEA